MLSMRGSSFWPADSSAQVRPARVLQHYGKSSLARRPQGWGRQAHDGEACPPRQHSARLCVVLSGLALACTADDGAAPGNGVFSAKTFVTPLPPELSQLEIRPVLEAELHMPAAVAR